MTIKRINITILVLTVLSAVLIIPGEIRTDEIGKYSKIIKFSHDQHSDIKCSDCHLNTVNQEKLSGSLLPEKQVCAECHDVEDETGCNTCHFEGKYEPYNYKQGMLKFSHSTHTDKNLCFYCHIEKQNDKTLIGNPEMSTCFTCHKNSVESENDCAVCHIKTDNLLPDFHNNLDFAKNHGSYSDQNCAMCHSNDFCSDCHTASGLELNGLIQNTYPILAPGEKSNPLKLQKLNRVHSMDYRFTHGIDARGKVSDCYTCHQAETFCIECHSENGLNPAGNSLLPLSHLNQEFITLGVGSGGGEHARQARNDIESCASCHDTQGSDPNCIMCHIDPDGIKRTNPSTHKSSFMSGSEGNWHSSRGAVCYNCHTDPNARPDGKSGLGFCGYCHGSK
ncbi:MAG: cytochrome C [Rhodothermaceae bacterium]